MDVVNILKMMKQYINKSNNLDKDVTLILIRDLLSSSISVLCSPSFHCARLKRQFETTDQPLSPFSSLFFWWQPVCILSCQRSAPAAVWERTQVRLPVSFCISGSSLPAPTPPDTPFPKADAETDLLPVEEDEAGAAKGDCCCQQVRKSSTIYISIYCKWCRLLPHIAKTCTLG